MREQQDENYLKDLGKRISAVRKEKQITQVELAYKCDIEKSNMNRIEAGNTNPTILLLRKICRELNVSLSELLNF